MERKSEMLRQSTTSKGCKVKMRHYSVSILIQFVSFLFWPSLNRINCRQMPTAVNTSGIKLICQKFLVHHQSGVKQKMPDCYLLWSQILSNRFHLIKFTTTNLDSVSVIQNSRQMEEVVEYQKRANTAFFLNKEKSMNHGLSSLF